MMIKCGKRHDDRKRRDIYKYNGNIIIIKILMHCASMLDLSHDKIKDQSM